MEQEDRVVHQSLLTHKVPNKFMRMFTKVDFFSFLPVPTDNPVSTRQSIVGSILFLIAIISYVLFDFISFVQFNQPIQITYHSPLDSLTYILPDFALAFMTTNTTSTVNDYTQPYNDLFTYNWAIRTKSPGKQTSLPIDFDLVTYLNNSSLNFDKIDWMNDETKHFYYILRTPTFKNLSSYGQLYSTPDTQYIQVKASFCINGTTPNCLPQENMTYLSNYGRFFLFLANSIDNSTVSLQTDFAQDDNYLLYNFFVIPNYYKRIVVKFQVVKTQILPDYFFRFTTQYNQRVQIQSVFEELSVVNSQNASNTDAIAFNFQLAPYIINNRISYTTIIDHVSKWGAFSGVLFSAFAVLFLGFNRKKFYNKNPKWDRFKKTLKDGKLQQKNI